MIPVVFISGSGRSGTTLVERCLHEVGASFSCGELRYFWERMCIDGDMCSCGAVLEECAFWRGFSGYIEKDLAEYSREVLSVQKEIDRNRYIFNFGRDEYVERFLNLIEPLYEYAYRCSGGRVLVDSSKHPSYLAILSKSKKIKILCVHVIRDARAVAYSWQKKVLRPESGLRVDYMPRFNTLQVIFDWNLYNLFFYLFKNRIQGYRVVSYEDFCDNWREVVELIFKDIRRLCGESACSNSDYGYHSVAGNPMRFRNFEGVKIDSDWKGRLSIWKSILVSVLTKPVRWLILRK